MNDGPDVAGDQTVGWQFNQENDKAVLGNHIQQGGGAQESSGQGLGPEVG